MKPADPKPCATCPWRVSNHGKRHAHGWYTKKNARRLWAGARTGNAPGMTCHATDLENPVPEGWPVRPKEGTQVKECAGLLLLVQREMFLFERLVKEDEHEVLFRYLKRRPRGLTRAGMTWWMVARGSAMAGTPFGAATMTRIDEDDSIQNPTLEQP